MNILTAAIHGEGKKRTYNDRRPKYFRIISILRQLLQINPVYDDGVFNQRVKNGKGKSLIGQTYPLILSGEGLERRI